MGRVLESSSSPVFPRVFSVRVSKMEVWVEVDWGDRGPHRSLVCDTFIDQKTTSENMAFTAM